ncbi:hypothetical protein ACP275_02G054700 [Erythranthe tilingii]
MDKIYEELEEVKIEAERLREECRVKTELSNSLRKAHDEQLAKIQQEKSEIDKLAQELNAKSVEICEIRQMYEELQSSLHRKDLFLQQISSNTEKLRAEYSEKILVLESENKDLVLALDEASKRIQDLEKRTCASSEEIAGLKRHLSIKPEKTLEAEKNVLKDLKERDEYILKLEEENRITKDQLKWKNEKFSHLEEAHKKIQTQFEASKIEWQKEKSSFIGEISSLQSALDAQIRVSEGLETQLRMSNQALAHEESRRKVLEVEVSETRSRFEDVSRDCQVAKSEFEELAVKRDEEIAELRMLVRKKEMLANEMNYKTAQLEQENGDLLMSLKDIQEAQINNSAASSLKKLRNKYRGLEQLHDKCAVILKEKDAEWNSRTEKLNADMNCCLSELDGKNKSIGELHKKLEDCESLMEVKNEEIFALMMVLKSQFYGAYTKLYDAKEELEMGIRQIEDKNMVLNQQLQLKDTELHKVRGDLKQRCDEMAELMERIESLDSLKQKDNRVEEEFTRYKAMLDESNECQCRLKQQLLELENSQRENIESALETVNFELANRVSEIEQYNLELQKSKSEMKVLKLKLDENQQAHNQEKASLVVTLQDKDAEISKLQDRICVLESEILAKSEAAEMLDQEKSDHIRLAEDMNCSITRLQNEVARLKNALVEKEAQNTTLVKEHERFSSDIKERDWKIQKLQNEFESLDQDFKRAMISFTEKEAVFDEALKTGHAQKMLEIEEKNQIIANLEKELNKLNSELGKEKRCNEELESRKQALLETLVKSSTERESLLAQYEGIYGQIGVFCNEDAELAVMLGKILHHSEEESEPTRNILSDDGFFDALISPSRKSTQVSLDERTPLTELNF